VAEIYPCRCVVEEDLHPGPLTPPPRELRHLQTVRRLKSGDPVMVLNGRGQSARATLEETGDLLVSEVSRVEPAFPQITLLVGALKQSAWDELLRHATALEVRHLVRVQCDHSVADLKSERAAKKIKRWRDCMIEACKQSANPWLPDLSVCGSVTEALKLSASIPEQWMAGWAGSPRPLSEAAAGLGSNHVAVWVGPEGDFSETETDALLGAGVKPVSLGERILRSETAAFTLLAVLRHRQS